MLVLVGLVVLVLALLLPRLVDRQAALGERL
jgi:hypothetical protein